MKKRNFLGSVIMTLALAAMALTPWATAQAQSGAKNMPRLVTFATIRPGTSLNALSTGVAKLWSEKQSSTKMRLRIVSGGLDAVVGAGEVDFGLSTSVNGNDSYNGIRLWAGKPQSNMRIAIPGPTLLVGLIVTKSSGMKKISDIKGKRMPAKFPNSLPFLNDCTALLGVADLTWSDVKEIPVSGIRENFQAFLEGRTDVALMSVGSGLVRQADAKKKGIRFLSLPPGPETARKIWAAEPGFYTQDLKKGFNAGIDRDMTIAAKDIYVTAHTSTSSEAVYRMAKMLWNDMETLHSTHRIFKQWARKNMSNARVTVPFHEGFIRFFKEIGEWSPAHEKVQKKLLAKASK